MENLLKILGLRRGHNSVGEHRLITEMLQPYRPEVFQDAQGTDLGYLIKVHDPDRPEFLPPVLFSSHVDTVHTDLLQPEFPPLSPRNDVRRTWDGERLFTASGQCLGADDGAGVWLMLEMIQFGVPGAYLFHRGEEWGGIGSSTIRKRAAEWLRGFKYAIAFDRRGTQSVITHQSGVRGCSNEFAQALAQQLNAGGLHLAPDPTGVYTDTLEYVDVIPECTNVSVGYEHEHTAKETLNLDYLFRLRNALCTYFDPAGLPVARDPAQTNAGKAFRDEWDVFDGDYDDLVKWVRQEEPEIVADLLADLAYKCRHPGEPLWEGL